MFEREAASRKYGKKLGKRLLALLFISLFVLAFSVGALAEEADTATPAQDDTSSGVLEGDGGETEAPAFAPMGGSFFPMAVSFDTLLKEAVLSIAKDGPQIADNTIVPLAQSMSLRYTFDIDVSQCREIYQNLSSNMPYPVLFPTNLKWLDTASDGFLSDLNVTVNAGNGTATRKFGELHVDKTNNRGLVYFNGDFWSAYWDGPDPDELPLENGYLYMGCQLNADDVGSAEQVIIPLKPAGKQVTLKIKERQKVDNSLVKTAGAYDATTGRFKWTVEYTPGDKELPVATWLHDVYNTDAHEFVVGSMKLNGGAFTDEPLTSTVVRDAPAAGQATLQVDLGVLEAKEKYIITYETALSDAALDPVASAGGALQGDGTTTAENQAFIRESQNTDVNKAASGKVSTNATPSQKQWMVKTGEQDATDGHKVNWTITIKTMDRRLTDLVLYDNFDSNEHTLVPGSVKVNGNVVPTGGITQGGAGTFGKTAPARPYQFSLAFPDVSAPTTYTVTYQTEVDSGHYNNCNDELSMDNEAWLDFNWATYGPGIAPVPPYAWPTIEKPTSIHTNVLKKAGTYDPATHTITWLLTLNPYKVDMGTATVTDDFENKGYTYVGGSFKTVDATGAEIGNSTRVTRSNQSTEKKLVLDIAAGNTATEREATEYFVFQTTVDNPLDYAYNSAGKKYNNTAVFRGEFAGVSNFEKTVTAEVSVASEVVKKTSGVYSYADNTITWNVVVNANKMPMLDAKLEDTMSAGQSYLPGSVTLTGAGQPSLPDSEVSTEGGKLTIDLKGLANEKTITVSYKTCLDADKAAGFKDSASATVTNSVRLLRNTYPETEKTISAASKTIDNEVLQKSGVINSNQGYIEYTVNINPNNLDLTGLKLKDTLPDSLALDAVTLQLHSATVNDAGDFTPGTPIGDAGSLRLQVNGAENSFTISLPSGKGRYVLVYRCDVVAEETTYDNKIEFLSGITGDAGAGQGQVSAGMGGGGASATAKRKFTLELTVHDALRPEIKLGNVRYGIFTLLNGVETCVYECTTDASGRSTVYPLSLGREYYIKQLSGAPGYPVTHVNESGATSPLESFSFQRGTKGTVPVLLQSTPVQSNVDFLSVNDWDRILSGIRFRLSDMAAGSSFAPLETSSAANGAVSFKNVPMGTYRLQQLTTDIQYHNTNNADYLVKVDANGKVSIYRASNNMPLQNGKYINEVKKADVTLQVYREETGVPLEKARFQALDKDGKVVAEGMADANGNVVFRALAVGESYTIVEVEVPGYARSPDMQISLTGENENGMQVEWPKTDRQFTGRAPGGQPGDDTPLGLWISLLGAMLATAGVCIVLKRRRVQKQ